MAGEFLEDVVGVGGTDVAGFPDEVVAYGADASSILVYLVFATGGGGTAVGDTVAAHEVVADDAHALAEDIIVDLVVGAGDGDGLWARGRRGVGLALRSDPGRARGSALVATEGCRLGVEPNEE